MTKNNNNDGCATTLYCGNGTNWTFSCLTKVARSFSLFLFFSFSLPHSPLSLLLDIHLGCERRVIFDLVNVLESECQLHQALLKDKREPDHLSMLAASQTRDKDSLTVHGVEQVLADLCATFDYVVLDSPAGIESGARHAMYFADDAIIVTNPELSACRDADKMIGFIWSKSRRAELGEKEARPVSQTLLINRYDPGRAEAEESLAVVDMEELLGLSIVGVIPGECMYISHVCVYVYIYYHSFYCIVSIVSQYISTNVVTSRLSHIRFYRRFHHRIQGCVTVHQHWQSGHYPR